MIGRVLPLAKEFSKQHAVHILVLGEASSEEPTITLHRVGDLPFIRTETGKKRLQGIALIFRLLSNALQTARRLLALAPDVVIIVKPLPHNVLGVLLWRLLAGRSAQVILDVDDFELCI